MKKVILAIILISIVLCFYYKDKITEYFQKNDIHIVDINLDGFKDEKLPKLNPGNSGRASEHVARGDDKLIQAIIRSDGEEVEKILASDENGEFIRMLKALKPEKIYSIQDVVRLNCIPGPACTKKDKPSDDNLKQCVDGSLILMNDELKKSPACKKDIDEFYTVLYLCQLYQNQSVCVQDDPIESVEDRSKRLTARGQNSVDCLMRHLDDFNAKNICIINTPRYTQSQFDEQVKKYCQQAISCNAFTKEADCIDKYKQLFKNDKKNGKDCTNSHLTALTQEFEILNFLLEKKFGVDVFQKPYDNCMLIKEYEQMIHEEEIFAKAKTIQDYTNMMTIEVQKYGHDAKLASRRLPLYFPGNDMNHIKMTSEYSISYNYYNACRIGHLSPK